jgi:YD repeat-containing protein
MIISNQGAATTTTYDALGRQAARSAYTDQVTGYAPNGQPSGTETIIPAGQSALAGTYTCAPTGQETSYTDSAAGGLPAETVTLGYNNAGEEDSLTGASPYANSLSYTNLGKPLQYTLGTGSEPVYVTDSYNPQTQNLTEQADLRNVLADFSSRARGAWLVVSCWPGGGGAGAGSEPGDEGVQDNVRRGPGGGRLG